MPWDRNGKKYFEPNGVLLRSQMAKILSLAYNLTGVSNKEFLDISKSNWTYPYVQGLAKNQVTTGYSNGKFGGHDYLTRVQFALMMARMLDDSFKEDQSVYPSDEWVAPVLKSVCSADQAVNYRTLQNELGFTNEGSCYALPIYPQGIIHVSEQGGTKVDITFFGWDDTSVLPHSYRVPIVAKELFKCNDIPEEEFIANGINIKAVYSESTGGITLMLR